MRSTDWSSDVCSSDLPEACEMREDCIYRLSRRSLGGQNPDLRCRMAQQKTQEIGSGVAAGTQDADPNLLTRHALCPSQETVPSRTALVEDRGAARKELTTPRLR